MTVEHITTPTAYGDVFALWHDHVGYVVASLGACSDLMAYSLPLGSVVGSWSSYGMSNLVEEGVDDVVQSIGYIEGDVVATEANLLSPVPALSCSTLSVVPHELPSLLR